MLLIIKELPLGEYLVIELQHGPGLRILETDFDRLGQKIVHNDGIHAAALQIGAYGDQQQVKHLILSFEIPQQMEPAKGEHLAARSFA